MPSVSWSAARVRRLGLVTPVQRLTEVSRPGLPQMGTQVLGGLLSLGYS